MKSLSKTPPSALGVDKLAKAEYKRILPLLEEIGANDMDLGNVCSYCKAFSLFQQASDAIDRDGMVTTTPKGFIQTSPYITILRDAQEKMIRLAKELLITPGARKRFKIDLAKVHEKDDFFEGG